MQIYNACAHSLAFYKSEDIALSREGCFILNNQEAKPIKVIPQMKPLNAQSNFTAINVEGTISFFRDSSLPADFLTNFYDFDIVVVSRFYAIQACKTLGIYPDFLDRLFVPNPLWTEDPKRYPKAQKCGCAGLTKFLVAKTPQTYVEELRMGGSPSIAAVKYCLQTFTPVDAATSFYLKELEQCLSYMEGGEEHV